MGVSSLIDTWLLLRDVQNGAERNRILYLVKSRGMAHSNQVREFLLTDHVVELRDVYVGSSSGLLVTGGAREALETQEKAQTMVRWQETERRQGGAAAAGNRPKHKLVKEIHRENHENNERDGRL